MSKQGLFKCLGCDENNNTPITIFIGKYLFKKHFYWVCTNQGIADINLMRLYIYYGL
jgi:uncharacterized sodium:solute symporter family permease YidK